MIGTSYMQVFKRLVNNFYLGFDLFWCYDLRDTVGYLLIGERLINGLYIVFNFFLRQWAAILTFLVNVKDDVLFTHFLQQADCRLESNEFAHARHIDTITIRETDLRSR